jgi:hypothetical protein
VWIGRVAPPRRWCSIGLAWIPVIQGGRGLYDYLQGVQAYLAPPIFVVFFLGVFMKRLNAKGCLAALVVGFAAGPVPPGGRHAGQARAGGVRGGLRRGLVPLDRQQHLLPVLQPADLRISR